MSRTNFTLHIFFFSLQDHGTNHRIASSAGGGDGNIWLPYVFGELGEAAALAVDPGGQHDLLQPQLVLEALLPHALLQLRPQPAVDQRLQLGRRHLGLRAGRGRGGWGQGGGRGGQRQGGSKPSSVYNNSKASL